MNESTDCTDATRSYEARRKLNKLLHCIST